MKDVGTLFTMDENSTEGQLFGLASPDLVLIKPNYEAMIKGGHLKVTEMGVQHVGKYIIILIPIIYFFNIKDTKELTALFIII